MRAALYARVSTERQADRGTIGSQVQLLRQHIVEVGDQLVGEYVDDGHSGARLDRPGLDALRDAAETGLLDRVWCLSPDRLARAYAYQVLVLDELARFGVSVAFADSPGLSSDDPQATLLTQVQGVIAEYEKGKTAERNGAADCSGPAPVRSSPGRPPTAIGAFRAARLPAKPTWRSTSPRPRWCGGSSPTAPPASACARSAADSTPTRYRHRPASPPGAPPRSAACCATRPTSAGSTTTAPNWCPTPAPPDTPCRCRATATNGSPSTAPASSPTSCSPPPAASPPTTPSGAPAQPGQWLLKGLVKCGVCGVGTNCHKMRGRNGTWHRYYYCRNHDPIRAGGESRRCPERNIRADALHAFVFDHIRTALTRPDLLLAGEQAVTLTTPTPDDELLAAELARLDRKLDAADAERRRLIDLYQADLIDLPEMHRRATKIAARQKELQHKRTSLAEERAVLARDNQLRSRVHDFAARIHAIIDNLDDTQKQQLLRLLIEDIHVTGWHVQIRLRIALDPPPPQPLQPTSPTPPNGPTGKPAPHPRPLSTQDRLRSIRHHQLSRLPRQGPPRQFVCSNTVCYRGCSPREKPIHGNRW